MANQSLLSHILAVINISIQFRYQLVLIISMMLYHSTQYYDLKTFEDFKGHSNDFILSLSNNLSVALIKIFLILNFITCLCSVTYVIVFKKITYFLEIFEQIMLPYNVYCSIRLERIYSHSNDTEEKVSWMIFVVLNIMISFIVCIVKNTKIQFRYDGIRQKSSIKVNQHFQIILLFKILINVVFTLCFPVNTLVYIGSLAILNGGLGYLIWKNVIYQNPKHQYLLIVMQFFSWIPIIRIVVEYAFQIQANCIVFYYAPACLCFLFAFKKPEMFRLIIQEKYLSALKVLKKEKISQKVTKEEESKLSLIVISVLTDIFLESPLSSLNSIQWSDKLKSQLLEYVKFRIIVVTKNPLKKTVYSQKALQSSNVARQSETPSRQNSMTTLQKIEQNENTQRILKDIYEINDQIKNYFNDKQNQAYHRKLIYQLIWRIVHQSSAFNNPQSTKLRYFIAYNFPDTINLMRLRTIFCYYLNRRKSHESVFQKLEAQICYKFLLSRIGSHRVYNKKPTVEDEFFENNRMQSTVSMTIINERQQKHNQNCMYKENEYYNPKFNDVLEQAECCSNIFSGLRSFIHNQKQFLSMFINLKQSKQFALGYYQKRNILRKQIKSQIADYTHINNKKTGLLLLFKYIEDVYLQKNVYLGYEEFQLSLQKLLIYNKAFRKSTEKRKGTEFGLSTKTMKNIRDKKIAHKNEMLTCVVSGIANVGNIFLGCARFQEIFGIELGISKSDSKNHNNRQQETKKYSNWSINSLILPIWRQTHTKLMQKIQTYEKPVDHISERYFMISPKTDLVVQVKFKMYFLMKQETDLLLILNLDYDKLEKLVIKDKTSAVVYDYGKTHSDHSFEMQSEQDPVEIFGDIFYIKSRKQTEFKNILDSFLPKAKSMCRIEIGKEFQENKHYREKQMSERRFLQYKKTFKEHYPMMYEILVCVFVMLLFTIIGFIVFVSLHEKNIQGLLAAVESKRNVQTEFCLFDSQSAVDIGMMYNVAIHRLKLDPIRTKKLKTLLFYSLLAYNSQTQQRMRDSLLNQVSNSINDNLFISEWIQGYEQSFIGNSLTQVRQYFDVLQFFVPNAKMRQYEKSQNELQMFEEQQEENFQEIQEGMYEIMHLNVSLSPKQEYDIFGYINAIERNHEYFYNPGGVVSKLLDSELQGIQKLKLRLVVQLWLVLAVVIVFTLWSFYKLFVMNSSLLANYNNLLHLSDNFRKKMVSHVARLQMLTQKMKCSSEDTLFEQIKPEQLNLTERLQKKGFVYRSIMSLQKNSNSQQSISLQTETQKDLNKKMFILKSFYSPIIRFIALLIIICVAFNNYYEKITKIQFYTTALTQFEISNAKYIKALEINLFASKKYTSTQSQNMFSNMIQLILDEKKLHTFQNLFVNKQSMNTVLYQDICQPNKYIEIKCPNFIKAWYEGFSSLKSSTIHALYGLSSDLLNPLHNTHDSSRLFLEAYEKTLAFLFFSDKLSHYTIDLLEKEIAKIDFKLYFLCGFIIVLTFFIDSFRLSKSVKLFCEQFLKIGSAEELKKERGFSYYVNLSKDKSKIFIHEELTFQHQH